MSTDPASAATPPGRTARKTAAKGAAKPAASDDRDMGSALRSVYQRTVEEDIPAEMLSLLGKLE